MVVFEKVDAKAVALLRKKGFALQPSNTIYEQARLSDGKVTAILYTSGKLLLQGKESDQKKIAVELRRLKIGEIQTEEKFRAESGWIIGSDECLKGDTFGGLVVAAVKADNALRQQLIAFGVKDSKKLADVEIIPLAEKIRKIVPCAVKSVLPEEYNQKSGTVTYLLNTLHQELGTYLAPGKHIVDKYPGCAVGNLMVEKGESKYVEVAAASILARDAGLKQLQYLSGQAGFPIPKGSTHVKLALLELKERGLEFRNFVKMDFRNVREFLKNP